VLPKRIRDNAKAMVATYWKDANAKRVEFTEERPLFDGTICYFSIFDADDVEHENVVYVAGDRNLTRYNCLAKMAEGIGPRTAAKHITPMDIAKDLVQLGGIAGTIAILITIAICYISAFKESSQIPSVMTYALTTILGFYFGAGVEKVREDRQK
jgi:hypothetical protein